MRVANRSHVYYCPFRPGLACYDLTDHTDSLAEPADERLELSAVSSATAYCQSNVPKK